MDGWFVYILECGDGTYYTGTTNDVDARVAAHSHGKGAKYVRGRLPVRVVRVERLASKGAALSREAAIKKLSRAMKRKLIGRGLKE